VEEFQFKQLGSQAIQSHSQAKNPFAPPLQVRYWIGVNQPVIVGRDAWSLNLPIPGIEDILNVQR
jgi:hypothetical protein